MDHQGNPTDAVLGNQGAQDFSSMISGSGAGASQQGSSQGQSQGTPNLEGRNDQQTGTIPRKALQDTQEGGQEDGQQQTGTGQQQGQGQGQGQAQNHGQSADHAALIKATADAVIAAQQAAQGNNVSQQQVAQDRKELTPAEFNAKYKVARANEELITTILGQDPKKAAQALDAYGQNLVEQTLRMAMDLMDASIGQRFGEIQPHIQSWQQYQTQMVAQQAEERFFKAYPQLAAERDLVMEIKDSYIAKKQAGQINFASEQEAFKTVADTAIAILRRVNPQWGTQQSGGNGGGQTQSQTTGQSNGRQMSALSSAGRSGTGQATVKSDVDHVFGEFAR